MKAFVMVAVTLGAVVLAGCASRYAADGERRLSCFRANEVAGWADAGARRFNLRTSDDEYYTALMMDFCPEVDFAQRIGLATRFGTNICEGDGATLIVPNPLDRADRCRVEDFRRLSPAEVAALPPGARP